LVCIDFCFVWLVTFFILIVIMIFIRILQILHVMLNMWIFLSQLLFSVFTYIWLPNFFSMLLFLKIVLLALNWLFWRILYVTQVN
jgi:hypothetical protein